MSAAISDAEIDRVLASLGAGAEPGTTERLQAAQARLDATFGKGNMKFEAPRKPFVIGGLYSRVWRAPYTNGLTDFWRERCMGYWDRISYRFGVIFSDPRNAWADDFDVGPIVATYATPLLIVPGERFLVPEGERIVH